MNFTICSANLKIGEASAVDSWLENWWTSVEGGGTNANANFAHDLASNFGPQSTDFNCGIGEISSCSSPGCIGEILTISLYICISLKRDFS